MHTRMAPVAKAEIDISSEDRRTEGPFVLVVRDFGRGIRAEHLPKVFDPFFTTGRSKGGTGLGMAIVHNIVTTALKGSIELNVSARIRHDRDTAVSAEDFRSGFRPERLPEMASLRRNDMSGPGPLLRRTQRLDPINKCSA